MMIGVNIGVVALIVAIGVIVNAYLVRTRLAEVLSDVEELIHTDIKGLEDKVEAAVARIRLTEARLNRE